ncbi:MAG: SanA/YdcF family protein [Ruminococcus sp.]
MLILTVIILLLFLTAAVINIQILLSSKKRILPNGQSAVCQDCNCILILGAAIWPGNVPCPILEDRLLTGISLYRQHTDAFLLMSGDGQSSGYNEVLVMKNFAMKHDVPKEKILTDPCGFTTFDSARRARDVFHTRNMIIVTQKYHLYRALYIAGKLGIQAWGVASDRRRYRRKCYREIREVFARIKYFFFY